MKIALYYPWIYLKSGVERTILETIKNSKHEYSIYTSHYDRNGTYPEFKKLDVKVLNKIPVRRNILSVIKASITIIFQKIDLRNFDAFVVHSEGLGDLILFQNSSIPTLCFCHTPMRPVFDMEYKSRARAKRSKFRKIIYRIMDYAYSIVDRYLWTKYKYIFFNSKESFSRARRGKLLHTSLRYAILNPGVNWKVVRPTWKYDKYFLVPGRIMWAKDVELAIESFLIFEENIKDKNVFKLIIAGQVDKKSIPYFNKLRKMAGGSKNISFVVNPSDKKMSKLYANCYTAFATSFNEDWGITPIEANSYGKPVLAINNGGFKESQINGKTGYLLNRDPKEFSSKLLHLAKNKRITRTMGRYARMNSKKYSWTKFIEKFDKMLDSYGASES